MDLLLTGARVVAADGVIEGGWLRVSGDRISDVGAGDAPTGSADQLRLDGALVVPGFVDLHAHGGGGSSMLSADPEEILAAAAFHAEHGTTRVMASLVSAPLEDTLAGLAAVREAVRAQGPGGPVLGSHLEGPFISPARAGAHDPAHLLGPDGGVLDRMLEAADGTLRVITVAPELPGALDLVRRATEAGVVVAVGHSEASADEAAAAFDAGATLVTHLFNAMPAIDHRTPGLATSALVRPEVTCELILDGVHVQDDLARVALAAGGSAGTALVTDAIPATGTGDGRHRLGTAEIEIRDGIARLAGRTTLAGSTLTMDVAFRRAAVELELGVEAASRAASRVPARVLGLDGELGVLAAGMAADLVILDGDLRVQAVMRAGEWTRSGRLFDR